MKKIKLTNSEKVALVDDEDFEWLSEYSWHVVDGKRRLGYAGTRTTKYGPMLYIHRLIVEKMFSPTGKWQVDHTNNNSLDNQRHNLRIANHSQNAMNSKKRIGTSSRYKGVCWQKYRKTWNAYIDVNKKRIHLGVFEKEIDAANAYDDAARKHFGEFARLNFPPN